MTFYTTVLIGVIIGIVYICFGVTAFFDRKTRGDGILPFINMVICCFLHLIVWFLTYFLDDYPVTRSLQFILCALYPLLGYMELFLYIRYYMAICGAKKKIISIINKFNYIILALNMGCTLFLLPSGLIFSVNSKGEYSRGPLFILTYLFIFIALLSLIIFTIIIRPSRRKTFAFITYSIMPIAASVLMVFTKINSIITDVSTMISFIILFSFVYLSDRFTIMKREIQLSEYRVDIMMSQIRPHFIYNTLSTIAALCTIDPEKAQNLTIDFSDYLRTNLNIAKMNNLIPFSEEFEHTKKYIDIEKVRFGDRINIEYDIKETDFCVPALSIQPIVENALKHGILKKEDGGTVWISTKKENGVIIISIKDDGVGFDSDKKIFQKDHYGLSTTKERIKLLLNGDFRIKSTPNIGTAVNIYINENENENENEKEKAK